MRKIAILLFLHLLTLSSYGDCDSGGLDFWPKSMTIRQNTLIVIEGYSDLPNIITGLNKDFPVYLKSGDKRVALTVMEILIGEFRVTQALLTMDELLEVGKEYELVIDNLPEHEKPLTKYNPLSKKFEKVSWMVTEGLDSAKAVWKSYPIVTKKTLNHYGCGPSMYVQFDFKIEDHSDILIKTTVTNKKTNKKTTYYLETNGTTLYVGHGMCSGAFLFTEGFHYDVTFDIMDASGNLTLWDKKAIGFSKPEDEVNLDE